MLRGLGIVQRLGHPSQVLERVGLQLVHRRSAVHLDRHLGNIQVAGDLLVESPCDRQLHHLPLSAGQRRDPTSHIHGQNEYAVISATPSSVRKRLAPR